MPRTIMLPLLIAVLFVLFPFLSFAAESDWEAFVEVKDKYYYLDKQPFNEISCAIDVPLMRNVIKQMNDQLAPVKENVEIKEDLSRFRLTFRPETGLHYSDPEFDVHVKSMEGVADPERAKEGICMMKMGFKQQVVGVKNIINGLFDDFQYPKKNKYNDLSVTKGKDSVTVEYTRENRKSIEKYSGTTLEIVQSGDNDNIESSQKYIQVAGGKLIFKEGTAAILQSTGSMEIDISVDYQELESIIFPKHINTRFQQTIQSISQSGNIDVNLVQCTLK